MDTRELFRVMLDFERAWLEAGVTVLPRPWGTLFRGEPYPLIYVANLAWVDRLPSEGPTRVLDEMDEVLGAAGIRFRSLVFADAQEAYEAQEAFAAEGFRPTAEIGMARVGLPTCIVNPDVEIREVGRGAPAEHFRGISKAIDDESGHSDDVHRQFTTIASARAAAVEMRDYVAYLKGEPAGTVSVWPRGRFAVIDNVATHPRFRMKGVGRTMIFEACNRAIQELCEYSLLFANLFETPQVMYKTLGFEPIGEMRGFFRGAPNPS